MDEGRIDRQRERWRRIRQMLDLADVREPAFALGGDGSRVKDLSVRILILPSDPMAHRLDFDDAFMATWKAIDLDPVTGQPPWWGGSMVTTSESAMRCDPVDDKFLDQYAAVGHDGRFDVGLAGRTAWEYEGRRVFNLRAIVGRAWAAFEIYSSLARAVSIAGATELTVALRGTRDAILGDFGPDWSDPFRSLRGMSICREENVLFRREIDDSDGDWPKAAAFSIGGQIENAFGSSLQRFRRRLDKGFGDFDAREYSWR